MRPVDFTREPVAVKDCLRHHRREQGVTNDVHGHSLVMQFACQPIV
jgi:hypothetical protein